jgi:hypothetical protein
MKWLVTTERKLDEAKLDQALGRAGAHLVEQQASVPLGQNEQVWEVEGPPNLDRKLAGVEPIKEVYPSSDMTLY